LSDAQDFYADMKARAGRAGRDPDTILVFPGIVPVIAATRQAAEDRLREMNDFAVLEHVLAKLSEFLGADLSEVDLDSPLPPTIGDQGDNQASQSRVAVLVGIARRERLTVRRLLMRLASGRGHLLAVDTGKAVADLMQDWFENGAADGFNVMCPVMPADLQSFAELVLPELRRRGLIREGRSSATLRGRYRLPHVL
nr:LLM class flavin-dependent oxidoreductase [Hyphomicrobiales bacterium]